MRSGNGRHRRPRQAPALIVAAGVTGSAIAIPLLGAGSASAADAATWDRVAECESGGMWSADFGNGQYGGLQFTQATWEDFGGTDYAPRADLASRSQQIAIAEKALAAQGAAAWATCAGIAGLTNDGTTPGVDPGDAPGSAGAATPTAPATPTTPTTPLLPTDPTTPVTPAPGTEPSQPVESLTPGTPAPSGTGQTPDAGTGKHRGAPSPEEAPGSTGADAGNSIDERDNGQHASRGDAPTRDASNLPDTGVTDETGANPGGTEPAETGKGDNADKGPAAYTVQPGDSLSAIAEQQDVAGGWPALYDANRGTVGGDPDLILPGQSLDLGAKQG